MAFLGKISAVISANTQDFTRNIGTAKRELQSFAQQTRGMQMNLDDRALNKTLTGLQRFQRQLQEIRRLRAAGADAGLPNPETLNDLYRAFEDIGKPLTALKTKIEGFSNSVQAGLYGELGRVQSGFQNLYKQIQNGAATFDGQTAKIERLQAALRNLSIAAAGVGELDSLSKNLAAENLGASFFQPYALDEMKRSQSLRGKAMGLPAKYRTGKFADRFMQTERLSALIAEESAKIAGVNAAIASRGGEDDPRNAGRLQSRALYQQNIDNLTRRLRRVNNANARKIDEYEVAQGQKDMFLQASGGLSPKLSQGARDAAADISVARQFRGQIASGSARISADTAIRKTTDAVTLLQAQMAKVASSNLVPAEKAKQLDILDNKIRNTTKGLSRYISMLSGGKFSTKQIDAAMTRARNESGSVNGKSAMLGQLAVQQAIFAFDDFMAASGGMEYKLRAISNNISQLGLLIGMMTGNAAAGLGLAVVATAAAQAFMAIGKYAFGLEDAKKKQAAMESQAKVLNASLERQNKIVDDLADAYIKLARAAVAGSETEPQKRFRERQNELREVRGGQAASRREAFVSASPDLVALRDQREQLKQRLEKAGSPAERRRLLELDRQFANVEDAAFAQIENEGRRLLGFKAGDLARDREAKAARLAAAEKDREALAGRGVAAPRLDDDIRLLRREVNAIDNAAAQRRQNAMNQATDFTTPLERRLEDARGRLGQSFSGQETFAQKRIAEIGRGIENLRLTAGDRGLTERQVNREAQALAKQFEVIDAVMRDMDLMGQSLEKATSAANQFEQEVGAESGLTGVIARAKQALGQNLTNEQIQQQRVAVENQTRAVEKQLERRQEQQREMERGAELSLSDREKTRRQMQKDVEALALANPDVPGIIDPDKRNQALQAGFRNVAEQAAPAMVSMFEQVQNAILQGPSRAALQASDITTSEGSKELGRLLRGEDAARNNQNLVELQKANENLRNLQQVIKDSLGITLEL